MGKLACWAQALDNTSPDHFEVGGEPIPPEDWVRRQDVVSGVSRVIKEGWRVLASEGVQMTACEDQFVLEVLSAQFDSAGRVAPIVCCGAFNISDCDLLEESVPDTLEQFAGRIGRTIRSEHISTAGQAFVELKKKSSSRKLVRKLGVGAAVLVVLGVAYWLASRG